MHTSLKIAGLSVITLAFTAGSAMAGDGKNCDHKKKAAMKTTATAVTVTPQTTVLSTTERTEVAPKKARKTYSFEDALKICQEKGVTDLQACIDYKTGVTAAKS